VSDEGRLYTRPLPGGGYVAIESAAVTGDSERIRAHVLVERRADPTRRVGHAPPVVAEAVAADVQELIDELYSIAANNVEVARALQRWAARRPEGHGPNEVGKV
jgi:hypothetical protein